MNKPASRIDLGTYFPALDGVRCLAMLLVLLSHYVVFTKFGPLSVLLGAVGVNLFFVLSGFLVARILLAQKEDPGQGLLADLRSFYTRRILRVVPLYYGLIILGLCFAIPNARQEVLALLSFTQNVPDAGFGLPQSGLYRIFWSLSAQLHFYLFLPLLLAIIPLKYARHFFIALVLIGVLCRAGIYLTDHSLYHKKWAAANTTLGCLDSFAIGSLLAWYYCYKPEQLRKLLSNKVFIVVNLLLFAGIAVLSLEYLFDPLVNIFLRLFCSLTCAWLIGCCVLGILPATLRSLLTRPFVVYGGKISYGVYVYQAFVPWLFELITGMSIFSHHFRFSLLVYSVLFVVITIAVAAASWQWIEKPLSRLKYKLPYR